MNNETLKNQFRSLLPKGFVDILKSRLQAKGINRSRGYISEVCNPKKSRIDNDVIAEAIALAKEEKLKSELNLQQAKALTI